MKDRFNIDKVMKITDSGVNVDQADGVADFHVACRIALNKYKLWKIKYKKLEKQGKMLKLPCAVGDTVYIIVKKDISKQKVREIRLKNDSIEIKTNRRIFSSACFGDTVFFTKEEAENVLKQTKGGL